MTQISSFSLLTVFETVSPQLTDWSEWLSSDPFRSSHPLFLARELQACTTTPLLNVHHIRIMNIL